MPARIPYFNGFSYGPGASSHRPSTNIHPDGDNTFVTWGGYNTNPAPTLGSNTPFGQVPGPIGVPNPAGDLAGQYPNLSGTNAQLSENIMNELSGALSPDTLNLIQDKTAAWGVASGMPLSGVARNKGARDLGLTSEALRNQGIGNYNKTIPTVSGTQTLKPALQAEIAARNATMAAAPNPAMAQSYAQQLFNQYLQAMRGPAGGTSGAGGGGGGRGGANILDQVWPGLQMPDWYKHAGGVAPMPGTPPVSGGSKDISKYWSPEDWGYATGGDPPITDEEWAFMTGGSDPSMAGAPSGTTYDPSMDTMNYNPFGDYGFPTG